MSNQVTNLDEAIRLADEFAAEEKKKRDAIHKKLLEVHGFELAEIIYTRSEYVQEYTQGWLFRYSLDPVDRGSVDPGTIMVTVNRFTGETRRDSFA